MKREQVKSLFESKFIKVYDLQYAEGKHYYDATRRDADHIAAIKTEDEFHAMVPDAVSCFVIIRSGAKGDRLLMSREFRYPAGRYLLSVPAGLIDPADLDPSGEDQGAGISGQAREAVRDAILKAARREIHEETNLAITDKDRLEVINPLVFSTPGMTDESNALVLAVVALDDDSVLNQKGAVGSEKFNGFVLLSKEDARRILKNGVDDDGHFYPLYSWAAMMYFVTGMWEE